jgi:hypothetical protein
MLALGGVVVRRRTGRRPPNATCRLMSSEPIFICAA